MPRMGLRSQVQRLFQPQQPAGELRSRLLDRAASGERALLRPASGALRPRLDRPQLDLPAYCWAQVCALTELTVLAVNRPPALQFYAVL